MPRKVFQPAEKLNASEVNTFLMDQAVMVFDDAAERTTEIPSPIQGMVTYLKDVDIIQVWNGSDWDEVSGAGISSSDTAPINPDEGDLWFNSTNGKTFVWYVDSDSAQWVEVGRASVSGSSTTVIPANGYTYVDTIYYTSNGTFTKATYPWLRAIRVKVQGAGGGGGGARATSSTETDTGAGGGGGGYAESFITDIAGLASSVTVTRGAGGAGGNGVDGGPAGAGGVGGSSSFGALVSASGGEGALPQAVVGGFSNGNGGDGGAGNAGDLLVNGSGGSSSTSSFSASVVISGAGGSSVLGGGARGRAGNADAVNGGSFGGGGGGACNFISQSLRTGGVGGNGIVIVELYA